MKRFFILLPLIVALTACDTPAEKACEAAIKDRLKSPASYQRVSMQMFNKPPNQSGSGKIEYDAANSYGALIRETAYCDYNGANDKVTELVIQP